MVDANEKSVKFDRKRTHAPLQQPEAILARLRILDAPDGPEPETPADLQRRLAGPGEDPK